MSDVWFVSNIIPLLVICMRVPEKVLKRHSMHTYITLSNVITPWSVDSTPGTPRIAQTQHMVDTAVHASGGTRIPIMSDDVSCHVPGLGNAANS